MGKRKSEYSYKNSTDIAKKLKVKIVEPVKELKKELKILKTKLTAATCKRDSLSIERQMKNIQARIDKHNKEDNYLVEKKKDYTSI